MRHIRVFYASLFMFLAACASTRPAGPAASPITPQSANRTLTVMLFPYIPDAAGDNYQKLTAYLKSQFQAQYPDITLNLVLSQTCSYCNTYKADVQKQIFTSQTPVILNAVELDTINLGDLVNQQYVPQLSYTQANQFPFAGVSTSVSGRTYAIPTWICQYFFYGAQSSGARAASQMSQRPSMAGTAAGPGWVNGDWTGSWTIPSLYLTAVADMKGYAAVVPAMTQPIDSGVAAAYSEVMANCTVNGANPCVNGTYHNSSNPAVVWQQYMQELYTNTTGFSENSFYISQAGGKQPSYIAPMLLSYSGVNNPLAYTDGLVINNSSCTGQCVQDVYAFATFYNSPAIRNYICFSQDSPGVPPRRLSPAIASFWSQQVVSSDPWYTQFKSGFAMAQAFPNQGMQAARGLLEAQLCTYMKANGIPDACKN